MFPYIIESNDLSRNCSFIIWFLIFRISRWKLLQANPKFWIKLRLVWAPTSKRHIVKHSAQFWGRGYRVRSHAEKTGACKCSKTYIDGSCSVDRVNVSLVIPNKEMRVKGRLLVLFMRGIITWNIFNSWLFKPNSVYIHIVGCRGAYARLTGTDKR